MQGKTSDSQDRMTGRDVPMTPERPQLHSPNSLGGTTVINNSSRHYPRFTRGLLVYRCCFTDEVTAPKSHSLHVAAAREHRAPSPEWCPFHPAAGWAAEPGAASFPSSSRRAHLEHFPQGPRWSSKGRAQKTNCRSHRSIRSLLDLAPPYPTSAYIPSVTGNSLPMQAASV